MSLMFSIRNLKLRYLILDLKILVEKSWLVCAQRTETELGSSVRGLTIRLNRSGSTNPASFNWQCDLKKWKNINTHPIVIVYSIITLSYFTLASAIFLILLWSQINVLSSIRLTGGRQIDFKVSSWMPKYF